MSQGSAQASSPTYRLSRHESGRGNPQKKTAAVSKAEIEEMAVSELRGKKLEKRRKAIQPVLEAARELGDQEIIDILSSARDERNATVQKQMILKAAKRINDIDALTERKDAGNTAASSSAHPSASSTSVSKKRTLESPEDAGGK